MGAYNRVNGEPCCGSKTLLAGNPAEANGALQGHVVSDCGAIQDFHNGHGVTKTGVESAAMAVENGCDLNCGTMYGYLMQALDQGLISEEKLTESVVRLFTTRMLLGEFEERCPFAEIGMDRVDHPDHIAQNLEAAKRSMVLLKNNGILPLNPASVHSIAVIGPDAVTTTVLEGNYNGTGRGIRYAGRRNPPGLPRCAGIRLARLPSVCRHHRRRAGRPAHRGRDAGRHVRRHHPLRGSGSLHRRGGGRPQ